MASVSAAWANAARAEIISAVREVTNAARRGRGESIGRCSRSRRDETRMTRTARTKTTWSPMRTRRGGTTRRPGKRCSCPETTTTTTTRPPRRRRFAENGVAYGVDLARGHKTGFYVDQRDNRAFIRDIAAGKDLVMDVCCYTGGFALNAALGGARRVIGVDSSRPRSTSPNETRQRNASPRRANSSARRRFGTSTRVWSAERLGRTTSSCSTRREFAQRVVVAERWRPNHVGLNQRAMRLLRPGGTLITCTCSGAVTQRGLCRRWWSRRRRRRGGVTMLGAPRGAGVDQPLDPAYPEGNYLTVVVCRVA